MNATTTSQRWWTAINWRRNRRRRPGKSSSTIGLGAPAHAASAPGGQNRGSNSVSALADGAPILASITASSGPALSSGGAKGAMRMRSS
jgi:hypothetical protein